MSENNYYQGKECAVKFPKESIHFFTYENKKFEWKYSM